MNFIKFYYVMGYIPIILLNSIPAQEQYKANLFPIFKEFLDKYAFANYSKNYAEQTTLKIVKELTSLLKTYDSELSTNEKAFLKGLNNLTKQFKRYIREQNTNTYPVTLVSLTTDKLAMEIYDLSLNKGIRPEITLLQDPIYTVMYTLGFEKALIADLNPSKEDFIKTESIQESIKILPKKDNKEKKTSFFNWF